MRRSTRIALGGFAVLVLSAAVAGAVEEDAPSESEATVRETELAFAASARERDLERFASFLHPETRFLGSGDLVLEGPEAVAAAWAPFFRADGPAIDWHPERVTVNEERGLAVSTGPYEVTTPGGGRSHGTFFSVWSRGEDGRWRILFDGGTPPEPVREAVEEAPEEGDE